MKPTSYIIHLPSGRRISAHTAVELETILSLNVCRVFQAHQIRIEPVFSRHNESTDKSFIRRQIEAFAEALCG